jgi:hypothetical protein
VWAASQFATFPKNNNILIRLGWVRLGEIGPEKRSFASMMKAAKRIKQKARDAVGEKMQELKVRRAGCVLWFSVGAAN